MNSPAWRSIQESISRARRRTPIGKRTKTTLRSKRHTAWHRVGKNAGYGLQIRSFVDDSDGNLSACVNAYNTLAFIHWIGFCRRATVEFRDRGDVADNCFERRVGCFCVAQLGFLPPNRFDLRFDVFDALE